MFYREKIWCEERTTTKINHVYAQKTDHSKYLQKLKKILFVTQKIADSNTYLSLIFFYVTDIFQHICFKLGVLIQHIWTNLKTFTVFFLIEWLIFFFKWEDQKKKIIIYINKRLKNQVFVQRYWSIFISNYLYKLGKNRNKKDFIAESCKQTKVWITF